MKVIYYQQKEKYTMHLEIEKQVRNESRCLFSSDVKDWRNAIESE